MNSDDFEKRVQRQSLRQIPAEWRQEILQAARAAVDRPALRAPKPGLLSTLNSQLSTHLQAWAALAAVWVAIAAMNFYSADKTTAQARNLAPPPPELIVVLQNQRRELAKLVLPGDSSDADKPKSFRSGPRSERRLEILSV